MALSDLLAESRMGMSSGTDGVVDEDRVARDAEELRKVVSMWRCYPDRFVDYLCSLNPHNTFHLYYYQRFYMRVCMRHRYVYATFTRGFSKSFLAVLILMIKAILYPGAKLGMASNVKNQSANILASKVDELCRLIPALKDEIEWDTRSSTAKTVISKDRVSYYFKNGSILENVAAAESSRGRRYQSILVEEAAQIDGKILNEVLLPMLNVERKVNGAIDKSEKLNRSQLFMNIFFQESYILLTEQR